MGVRTIVSKGPTVDFCRWRPKRYFLRRKVVKFHFFNPKLREKLFYTSKGISNFRIQGHCTYLLLPSDAHENSVAIEQR